MTAMISNPSTVFATRQQVTAALERASQRAKQVAEQTGTQWIVGKPVVKPGDTTPQAPENSSQGLRK